MTSMLSHSCHPNVEQTIGDHSGGLVLDMVTLRPVAAGSRASSKVINTQKLAGAF